VRGSIDALALNGRRIAWIRTRARCGRQVQILTLPRRRAVYVGSKRGRSCGAPDRPPINALALGGDGRVLWQRIANAGNTVLALDVFTAALRAPRTDRTIALEFAHQQSDPDYVEPVPLPTAADADAVLFYAVCETEYCNHRLHGGAILRLAGSRWKRLSTLATTPVGLAVSGRRYAVATKTALCCNDAPAWSHDGTRLAWIHRGNLWTIRADGTGERVFALEDSWPDDALEDRIVNWPLRMPKLPPTSCATTAILLLSSPVTCPSWPFMPPTPCSGRWSV
jgi:hypothetical protein